MYYNTQSGKAPSRNACPVGASPPASGDPLPSDRRPPTPAPDEDEDDTPSPPSLPKPSRSRRPEAGPSRRPKPSIPAHLALVDGMTSEAPLAPPSAPSRGSVLPVSSNAPLQPAPDLSGSPVPLTLYLALILLATTLQIYVARAQSRRQPSFQRPRRSHRPFQHSRRPKRYTTFQKGKRGVEDGEGGKEAKQGDEDPSETMIDAIGPKGVQMGDVGV